MIKDQELNSHQGCDSGNAGESPNASNPNNNDIVKAINNLPSVATMIKAKGFNPKKSLGQNFITDISLTKKIVKNAGSFKDINCVIEVGPGPGALTRALLLEPNIKEILCIDKDPRAIDAISDLVKISNGKLHAIEGDAMDMPLLINNSKAPRMIIANLPYNISTQLLLGWLENIDLFDSFILMFQKEVAQRIVAKPGTKEYGRLSVMSQFRTNAEILFHIQPEAFFPAPKIVSSVVKIKKKETTVTKDNKDLCSWSALEKVTKAAFSQRRKKVKAGLKSIMNNKNGISAEELCGKAGISPDIRAEEISVEQFQQLAKAFEEL